MAPTILVSDNEPFIAEMLATVLANEGSAVAPARDGLAALATIERARPDVLRGHRKRWFAMRRCADAARRPPLPRTPLFRQTSVW